MAFTVSVAAGSMATGSAPDVPPPGAGLKTETVAVPTTRSAAATVARSCVLLRATVGWAMPFHCSVDRPLKPEPVTVNVAGAPARTRSGVTLVIDGCGLVTGVSEANAWNTLTRVRDGAARPDAIVVDGKSGIPQRVQDGGDAGGRRRLPHQCPAPATCGAAIDVPLATSKPPPGTDEVIDSPGANSDRNGVTFENHDTASAFVVDPALQPWRRRRASPWNLPSSCCPT